MEASAIFGFAGVLVGAGSTYLTQRSVGMREDRGSTKAAVRVLQTDTLYAIGQLVAAVDNKLWWTVIEEELTFPNWDRYEDLLARVLRYEQWLVLRNSITGAVGLEDRSKWSVKLGNEQMSADDIKDVAKSIQALGAARAVLVELAMKHNSRREKAGTLWRRAKRWFKQKLSADEGAGMGGGN